MVTRDSDKNERKDVFFPTEGLAKHNYKNAFVNMRSVLMEGGSGWCQLVFVQCRKPRCLFPPGTPSWPQGFGKAARQGEDEQVTGPAIAAAPSPARTCQSELLERGVRIVVGHSHPSLSQTTKHSREMMWQKAPCLLFPATSILYLEELGFSQQG